MCIYHDDMVELMGGDIRTSTSPLKHLMGYQDFHQADGSDLICEVIAVEVNMIGKDDDDREVEMADWTTIACAVFNADSNTPGCPPKRLSGPWLRKMLYAATAPEENPTLYIGEKKTDITSRDMLPRIRPDLVRPPVFLRPPLTVQWVQDQQSGMWYPLPEFSQQGITPKHVRFVPSVTRLGPAAVGFPAGFPASGPTAEPAGSPAGGPATGPGSGPAYP